MRVGAEAKTHDVVVERDVMVGMRDGVRLATDMYFPAIDGERVAEELPAVLMRTPYDKSAWGTDYIRFFAAHGYVSVMQDCRGRGNSEGIFFPFRDDPEDGYDTIEWLADHPACNGKVGMHGPSYMAWVQFHAAALGPPALVTMIPHHGPINSYKYSTGGGGTLHLGLLRWILSVAATSQEARLDPDAAAAVREMMVSENFLPWCARLPWRRGETPLAKFPAYEEAAMQLYCEHFDYDEFWRQPGFAMDEHFDAFPEMPILWVTSWFDWYPRTMSDGFQRLVAVGREDQHILIGPWSHNSFHATVGDVDFGADGAPVRDYNEFLRLELAWFDRWMKDERAIDPGATARFFVMGGGDGERGADGGLRHGGHWRESKAWPPPTATAVAYYLHKEGSLAAAEPEAERSSTTYTYDPGNTVSSNGRCIIAYGPAAASGFAGMGPRDQVELATLPGHGTPGAPIAERPDVLVFQTPPLEGDVTIAGDIGVRLWVSSDAPDTDFYVKLIDEYASGYGFPVSEGILRARYRHSFATPEPMALGEVYCLEFPLEPAANLFRAGHRIRLYICSSNFPNFDINRNTCDPRSHDSQVARNTIHHDAAHPSSVTLPVDASVWLE